MFKPYPTAFLGAEANRDNYTPPEGDDPFKDGLPPSLLEISLLKLSDAYLGGANPQPQLSTIFKLMSEMVAYDPRRRPVASQVATTLGELLIE